MNEINTPESSEQQNSFTEEKTVEQRQYSSAPPPNRPVRVRRVGTFTMGLSLIAAGVIALFCLLAPSVFDVIPLLRFSPVILIFLGIEVLLSHLLHRYDQLKYDFFSGVICFILICFSVGTALVPPLFEQYGPEREGVRSEIESQIEGLCYQALGQDKTILSLSAQVYLNGSIAKYPDASVKNLGPHDALHLRFLLTGDHTDQNRFAQDVRKILDQLQTLSIRPTYVHFQYENNRAEPPVRYDLDVSDSFALHQDVTGLTRMIERAGEREQLEQEREQFYEEMEEQREQLSAERGELYENLQEERDTMYQELQEERENLYHEVEQQRQEMQQANS